MKKFVCFGLLCLLLSGCSNGLDDSYDREQLKEKASEVINDLNVENYPAIVAMGDENMNQPTLEKSLKEAWSPAFKEFGSFVAFDSFDYTQKDDMAIVIVIASYQNNKVQFTISFNQDMQLSGLYFK